MAQLLGVNERSVRFLYSGERPVHDGFAADVQRILRAHAADSEAHARNLPA